MPKIAAPTNSLGMPRICRPSNFVNRTTTSSGTRQMRVTVSEFGRFMARVSEFHHDNIGGCDEGDPARGGQGHTTPPANDSHTETDRADLRAAVSPLPTRPAEASAGDRRSHSQSQLPAAA